MAGAIGASGANARAAVAAVFPSSSGNVIHPYPPMVASSVLVNGSAIRSVARRRVRRRSPASGRSSVRAMTTLATKEPPTSGCPSSIRVSAAAKWAILHYLLSLSLSVSQIIPAACSAPMWTTRSLPTGARPCWMAHPVRWAPTTCASMASAR